jgi:hypothetical protein
MIQLFKKFIVLCVVCLAIAGCGDQQRINELQTQLGSCTTAKAQTQTQADTNYDALNSCTTANKNLYKFVDDKGTFLDKTAKIFDIYPWQTCLIAVVLLILFLLFGVWGLMLFYEWQENTAHRVARGIIENAKEARQELFEAENRLTHLESEINAASTLKTNLTNELKALKEYGNIDALKEKEKIISEAKKEASRIFEENTTKINARVKEIETKLNKRQQELNQRAKKVAEDAQQVEEDRKALQETF